MPAAVTCAKLNHNKRVFITGDNRGNINFYDKKLEFSTSLEENNSDPSAVTAIAFNEKSTFLAVGQLSGIIKVMDIQNCKLLHSITMNKGYPTAIVFTEEDHYLIYGSSLGQCTFYSLFNGGSNEINQYCKQYTVYV